MAMLGIDVSADQGVIDWQKVAADPQGIKRVRIQASFGAEVNPAFVRDVRGALAAGLEVGAYHFAYDSVRAVDAADAFLEAVGRAGGPKRFALRPALDYEQTSLHASGGAVRDWATTWLEKVAAAAAWRGGAPGIYSDPGFWNPLRVALPAAGASWVADLTEGEPTGLSGLPDWECWQFSWSGRVQGIEGPVDMDRWRDRVPSPTPVRQVETVYAVKPGDTLWAIATALVGGNPTAREVEHAIAAIATANRLLSPYTIFPGQKLTIPAAL